MAPDLALNTLVNRQAGSVVVDPMCGSGMVLRTAATLGYSAFGVDMDPLAVLMASVWTSPLSTSGLVSEADRLLEEARSLSASDIFLPWIDDDRETTEFISYWFAEPQLSDLRRLSYVLNEYQGEFRGHLRLALSRIIITKKRGASLAWDVSHSRPHRVMLHTDYDVYAGFMKAASHLEKCLQDKPSGEAAVKRGDARNLDFIADGSADVVMTSPPYLNAIDYLRGHRLSLVWLGFSISSLRTIRADSVGAERMLRQDTGALVELVSDTDTESLSNKMRGVLYRYASDAQAVMKEVARVLKPGGNAILVVGNSTVRGTFVDNAGIMRRAGELCGLSTCSIVERDLPALHRYLPPPSGSGSTLDKRMRTETVLTLSKAGSA